MSFNRQQSLASLQQTSAWDVIVIGGGATGLGTALDAASRGFSTLLLEASDFAKGTSSRSTKLVHGGVRYLAQGSIRLVFDALRERGLLLKNAGHLVKRQSFVIPCYGLFSKLKYLMGLTLYDWLSGGYSFGKSRLLSREETIAKLPSIRTVNLTGGIEYFDGQFDDARLAVNIAQTIAEQGGTVLNHCKVVQLLKENGRVCGVIAVDREDGRQYTRRAKAVINATGVFVDNILQMDEPGARPMVRPSQGVHIVVNMPAHSGYKSALMIPQTADGRVLFAVPWHQHMLIGTTDTPLTQQLPEPVPLKEEIRFILDTLRQYVTQPPEEKDILSLFAGLRPLAAGAKNETATKEISRDHKLIVNASGLITITGGKWTTYRKMAEVTIDKAIATGGLANAPCKTKQLPIHGCCAKASTSHLALYGTDEAGIRGLMQINPALDALLAEGMPYTEAEVVWAVRHEMARTVEDVLARRIRLLFLDARAAIRAAPRVAALMARELHHDEVWQQDQTAAFTALARNYLIPNTELQPASLT